MESLPVSKIYSLFLVKSNWNLAMAHPLAISLLPISFSSFAWLCINLCRELKQMTSPLILRFFLDDLIWAKLSQHFIRSSTWNFSSSRNGEGGEEPLPHAGFLARRRRGHRCGARPAVTVGQPEAPALRQGAAPRRRGRRHRGRREGPAPRRGRSRPPRSQVCAFL